MIKRNEELLEFLEEAEKLALEQRDETKTNNLDVIYIRSAKDVVGHRLNFLRAEAAKKKAPKAAEPKGDGKPEGDKQPEGTKNNPAPPANPEGAAPKPEGVKT